MGIFKKYNEKKLKYIIFFNLHILYVDNAYKIYITLIFKPNKIFYKKIKIYF